MTAEPGGRREFNYDGLPRGIVAKAIEAGAAVTSMPFAVAFDRVTSFAGSDALVLRGGDGVDGIVMFHHALGVAMRKSRLSAGSQFTPHITLLYDGCRIKAMHRTYSLDRSRLCPCAQLAWQDEAYSARTVASWRVTFFAIASGQHDQVRHDLRHQELRHDEEGARLARRARRRLRIPRLQDRRHRPRAGSKAGARVGWETLLNRAGTTFRKLPDEDKEGLDEKKAIALMLAQPSMIKRPVLE